MKHVSWGVFMLVYVLAWNKSILDSLKRYQDDAAPSSNAVIGRSYLFTLCAFALVTAWIHIVYVFLMTLLILLVLLLIAPYTGPSHSRILRSIVVPSKLLQCIGPDTIGLHLKIALATLFFGIVIVGFYVKDSDLRSDADAGSTPPPSLVGKIVRALYVPAAIVLFAYVIPFGFSSNQNP